jgi:Protein of unknown function (DUF2510)
VPETPAGWYPAPNLAGSLQYWDGQGWAGSPVPDPAAQQPYQPYVQQTYGQQPYGTAVAPAYPPAPPVGYSPPPGGGTNVLAVLSVVLAFVFAPAGLVCGIIALRQTRGAPRGDSNRTLAIIGTVVSGVFTAISVAVILFLIAAAGVVIHDIPSVPSIQPFPTDPGPTL